MSRGGEPCQIQMKEPRVRGRTEALPVGTGAARALPFGKDTRNLQINPSAALIQINRWIPNKHCRGPRRQPTRQSALTRCRSCVSFGLLLRIEAPRIGYGLVVDLWCGS